VPTQKESARLFVTIEKKSEIRNPARFFLSALRLPGERCAQLSMDLVCKIQDLRNESIKGYKEIQIQEALGPLRASGIEHGIRVLVRF